MCKSSLSHRAVSARDKHRCCRSERAFNIDTLENCMFLGQNGERRAELSSCNFFIWTKLMMLKSHVEEAKISV